jgi:hypothetical protein
MTPYAPYPDNKLGG